MNAEDETQPPWQGQKEISHPLNHHMYNSNVTNKTDERKINSIRYLKVFNVTPEFRERFGGQTFICRLIWCHLKDLSNVASGASTRSISKEWGLDHKTVAAAIQELVDAGYVVRDGIHWKALPADGMFKTTHVELWRWKPGKTVNGHRWTVYTNAVFSFAHSGLRQTASIATALCISPRTVRRIYSQLEKAGYLKRDKMAGLATEVKLLPLNGHSESFIKTVKKEKAKQAPKIGERTELSKKHEKMKNVLWPNGGYVEWKKKIMEYQGRSRNGRGSPIKYLEECIAREYWPKYPPRISNQFSLGEIRKAWPFLNGEEAKSVWNAFQNDSKEMAFYPGKETVVRDGKIEAMIDLKPKSYQDIKDLYGKAWSDK